MNDIRMAIPYLIAGLKTHTLLVLTGISILTTTIPVPLKAQVSDPSTSIRQLREGYLILRMPAYRSKIDTLTGMTQKTTDPTRKARLEKQLQETIDQRDTMHAHYIKGFKNQYQFSKVAYFYDYEGHNLNTATYYDLEGNQLPTEELGAFPVFYLFFERTAQSKIDALVVYDRNGNRLPPPFPNNFSRGGINILFLGIANKNFPAWRVSRINRQFFKYWGENQMP